jgi:hypothetical protein
MKTFNEFVNESYSVNEGMTFQEIKDKYLDNPYGIGANSVEYIESSNGWPARLIFRDETSFGRNDIEKNLKALGVPAKKLSKNTADKAYKWRYELTMYESEVNEALAADNQVIDIVKEIALNIFGEKAITMIDQDMIEISTAATSKSNVDKFTKEVEETLNKTRSTFDIEVDEKEKSVKIYA